MTLLITANATYQIIYCAQHMIWNVAAEQFPGAIEIVDIYHAKQHLCDVAKAI